MATAYLGLGSNQDNPTQQLAQAIKSISSWPFTQLLAQSSLYQTRPLDNSQQANFFNQVIAIQTNLCPENLLKQAKLSEKNLGRVATWRWGPRVIDIDILLYEQITMQSKTLTLPHPGMKDRDFVLYPLVEIAPHLAMPNGESIKDLIKNCSSKTIVTPETQL